MPCPLSTPHAGAVGYPPDPDAAWGAQRCYPCVHSLGTQPHALCWLRGPSTKESDKSVVLRPQARARREVGGVDRLGAPGSAQSQLSRVYGARGDLVHLS